MKKFEELLSMNLTQALAKDNKPKSIEKTESKAADWNTNMDNHNDTNTSPTPSKTNAGKNNDGDGVKAPKLGRQISKKKSAPQAEEVLSPPPKKPSIDEVNTLMEAENRAIFQTPPTVPVPSFYNNYAEYGFPHPNALRGYPIAISTPLMNPEFVCSTSSQIDSSMMDVKQETSSGELSVSGEAENEQSMTEDMGDTTAMWNTKIDLGNYMEDQANDYERNGPTYSGETSIVDPQLTMLMPMQKMPITPKPEFSTPHSMFCPPPFGHPCRDRGEPFKCLCRLEVVDGVADGMGEMCGIGWAMVLPRDLKLKLG